MRALATVAGLAGCLLWATEPSADIYAKVDKHGVIHFTNIPRHGKRWRRIIKTGPGKAQLVHARRRPNLSPTRYRRYDALIGQASRLYHIPQPLIRAVIRVESDFDKQAVSSAGAKGLMQLLDKTARGMGASDSLDPHQNIFAGTRYLRVLANRFRGDLQLTLAAYHAGPGAVLRYGRQIPPFATTRRYVRMVLDRYRAEARRQTVAQQRATAEEAATP